MPPAASHVSLPSPTANRGPRQSVRGGGVCAHCQGFSGGGRPRALLAITHLCPHHRPMRPSRRGPLCNCHRPSRRPARAPPARAPEPYSVFGLIPTVPATRDPAVIERYYRNASDVLNHTGPYDPCAPAIAQAARLVADAWAFLSDPDCKASLDSRFEDEAAAAVPTAPPQPTPQMTPRPPTAQAVTTQAGLDGLDRGKRLKKPLNRMNL